MKDYRVTLDVQIPAEEYRDMMAVELAEALEEDERALGPIASGDESVPALGAVLGVWAENAAEALERAQAVMMEAMGKIGVRGPVRVIYAEVVPYDWADAMDEKRWPVQHAATMESR